MLVVAVVLILVVGSHTHNVLTHSRFRPGITCIAEARLRGSVMQSAYNLMCGQALRGPPARATDARPKAVPTTLVNGGAVDLLELEPWERPWETPHIVTSSSRMKP